MKRFLSVFLNTLFLLSLLILFICLITRIWITEKELVDNTAWSAFFTLIASITFYLLFNSTNKPKEK